LEVLWNFMTYKQEAGQLTHPKYRPDIDGLRAIGVLSVVVFHAFPRWIPGGFIGVDIFFVISGYLISTIIFENLERGTFSFRVFYARRIKRIFPALLIVLATSLIFGWFGLGLDALKTLGMQIAAGAGFFANFLMWQQSGYFDGLSSSKPMLHLWSLSVEEQFYIVWPFLLWLSWKNKINILLLTLILLAGSFAWNIWEARMDVVADFYSPLTRFYELLIGACLAYISLFNPTLLEKFKAGNGNVQSLLGAAGIAGGFALVTSNSVFPGWWALLPTLGTAAIIAAGKQAWFNHSILSSRILVWFGLISFPLYLWHWPLIAFAVVKAHGTPPRLMLVFVIALSIALAWLTYTLIERPVRFGKHSNSLGAAVFAGMVVAGIVAAFVGPLAILMLSPAQAQTVSVLTAVSDWKNDLTKLYGDKPCFKFKVEQTAQMFLDNNCVNPGSRTAKSVFLIGDSFSASLSLGLRPLVENKGLNFQQVSTGFCEPTSNDQSDAVCKNINQMVMAKIGLLKPDTLILMSNWLGASKTPYFNGNDDYNLALLTFVRELRNRGAAKVIVIGQMPTWQKALPDSLIDQFVRRNQPIPARTFLGLDQQSLKMDSEMRKLNYPEGVSYVSMTDALCDRAGCLTSLGPNLSTDLVVWDYGHLTPMAAGVLSKKLLSDAISGVDGRPASPRH
jgi:peptidoglycan/LPS O-acetylase OafA/YrhL